MGGPGSGSQTPPPVPLPTSPPPSPSAPTPLSSQALKLQTVLWTPPTPSLDSGPRATPRPPHSLPLWPSFPHLHTPALGPPAMSPPKPWFRRETLCKIYPSPSPCVRAHACTHTHTHTPCSFSVDTHPGAAVTQSPALLGSSFLAMLRPVKSSGSHAPAR